MTDSLPLAPDDMPWDTSNLADPQPVVYPYCTECFAPYVFRKAFSLSAGPKFVWFTDCTGKKHKAVMALMTHDGPYTAVPG